MKKLIIPVVIAFSFLSVTLTSCEQVTGILEEFLSEGDATEALKEALRVGSDTAVEKGSAINGYFLNQAIKILLPPEADLVLNAASLIPGVSGTLDQLEEKLNRAAEDAAPQARDILIDAILNITITDAVNIVNGENDAATQYLKDATQSQIAELFKPHIENSLESVGAQTIWENVAGLYNPVAPIFDQPEVDTDLSGYTTNKALDGLFYLVAEEEEKIREDPLHRVSEILQQVFGD